MQICMMKLGDVLVELIAPIGNKGIMAKFLEKRGEGFHHICYEVENVYSAMKELAANGLEIVDKEPREGAEVRLFYFIKKAQRSSYRNRSGSKIAKWSMKNGF
jgi:methylmalonyl-CoA epimerase